MPEKKREIGKGIPLEEGHQPADHLDTSEPPQGGSGVPSNPPSDSEKTNEKD